MLYHKKIIFIFIFFTQTFLLATTWNTSPDGKSTSTTPSPYDNNTDIRTSLSINGASSLVVTISGELEDTPNDRGNNWYDAITITDNNGGIHRYKGQINDSFTVVGSSILIRFTSDYSETRQGVAISIKEVQDFSQNNPRNFKKVNIAGKTTTNIYGDLLVIGNQSLCWKGTGNTCKKPSYWASNNGYPQKHANLDPQAVGLGFLNSTSSYLKIGSEDTVVEAWLFALGRIYDKNLIPSAQYIQLKTPTSNGYIKLKAPNDKFNWMKRSWVFDYGIAIDITSYVQKSGDYWVADLISSEGRNLGSGWGIAVIVEDKSGQKRTLKNISLYNGFNGIYNNESYPNPVTSKISGFLTPRTGEVKSKLILMGAESDRGLNDTMSITKKDGSIVLVKDSLNNINNIQNGTISKNGQNVTTRNPNYENTLGIDIDEIDVSSIIGNNQKSTDITITSKGDLLYLNMYGFATELYTPKLCYDYAVRMGDHIKIPSKNNDINTSYWQGEPLLLKIFIHNLESDFDLTDTRLKIHFDKKNKLAFKEDYATVSPPGINAYLPAVSTGPGQIAIGEDNTDQGGLIGANISLYAKMGYKVLNPEALSNHFDLEIKTKMQFSPDDPPVEYTFTSAGNASNANHIGLCPRDPVYHPVYERFNIERAESTFSQVPKVRYPLYTQMTGKDFNVSIASYGGIDFEDPLTVNETTVELELIDAGNFDNNSSAGYDNVCEEPTSVAGSGTFINFNNTDRVNVNLKTQLRGFNNNIALQSAAFRVWVLTKKDSNTSSRKRVTVRHTCTDITKEKCFQSVYNKYYKDDEDAQLGLCAGACGSTSTGCYQCLKEYFATPFCSRDNFSIRPESFRVAIADTNESTDSNLTETTTLSQNDSNSVDTNLSLAAGYQYSLDINATCFGDQKRSLGYYNNTFKSESNISNIAYITSRRVVAPLLFNDVSACANKTHRTLGIKLQNGRIVGDKSIAHDNVGAYKFSIRDSNWTNVDQASYPYKTIFDPSCKNSARPECSDCEVDSSSSILLNNKIGCDIDSNLTNREDYISLPLVFHPYAFGVNTIQKNRPDRNILFMNNFDDPYYSGVLSDHLSMATSFEGNITALNKQGTIVSNFTKSCVASDVNLDLARTMNPSEDMLIASGAPLQQYLEVDVTVTEESKAEGKLTLDKETFKDENKGQVTIQLHTTLKKPLGYGNSINPVQIRYDSLKASSIAQSSNAHMKADYIPEGKRDYDNNITYVYGKVTPENRLYKHIEEDGKRTPIYVDIFCDLDGTLCADSFGLRTNSLGREEIESGWKLATIFDSTTIGTTDIEVQYLSEKNADAVVSVDALVAKKLAKDVIFNDGNATQNDINISVRNEQRNSMIKVIFKPVPWLRYEVEDYYRLHFVGPSSWAGVGKTGHVTDSKSSDTQNNRMNW